MASQWPHNPGLAVKELVLGNALLGTRTPADRAHCSRQLQTATMLQAAHQLQTRHTCTWCNEETWHQVQRGIRCNEETWHHTGTWCNMQGHNLPPLDQCTGLHRSSRQAVNTWFQRAGLSVRAERLGHHTNRHHTNRHAVNTCFRQPCSEWGRRRVRAPVR